MPTNNILVTTDYIFSPQTVSPALTGGMQATISLTPVPLGVNANDTNHLLRLVTATTTESVPIQPGGTAVSGAASGTIKFTPANSYAAGTCSIQTATAGIQEAVIAAADNNGIHVPPGVHFIYAPITVPAKQLALFGEGIQASKLVRKFTSGNLLEFPSTLLGVINIRCLELSSDVVVTSGAQLRLVGFTHGIISDLYVSAIQGGLFDGILADQPNGTILSNIEIREVRNVGLGITCVEGHSAGLYDNIAISAASSATCILLEANSSFGFVGPVFSNIILQGGAFGVYMNANGGNVNEGRFSNLIADSHTDTAIYMAGTGGGGGETGGGQSWSFDNVVSGVAASGRNIFIDSGWTNVQFTNINVGPGVGAGPAVVELAGCRNVQFANSVISGRGWGGSDDVAVLIRTSTVGSHVCRQIAFTGCVVGYNQNGDISGANYAQYGFKVPNGNHELISIQNCKIFGATDAMSLNFGSGASCFLSDNWYASTTAVTKPSASSVFRRSTWFTEAGGGTADQYELCSKDSSGSYAWRTLV